MTSLDVSKDPKTAMANAEKALSLPIGIASPLWMMFAGAASVGVAYWWMARWRTATNLEAQLAPALAELPAPEPMIEAAAEVAAAPAEAVETVAEPVAEAVAEATVAPVEAAKEIAEPIAEVIEPLATEAPAPILEIAPTPKPKAPPKAKAAAVRAAPRTTSGPTRR